MVRLFKIFSFFYIVSCATLFVGDFGIHRAYAFTCTTSCPARAQKVKQELADLKSAGVSTYIYWQYSGSCSVPWQDSNDPYSFFQGDPLCEVFKEAAASGMTIGVNAHHLSTHIGEADQLAYLHNDCGVSIVRFWAYPNIGTGASTARATVDAITAAGMKAIPVICDYSNTCTDLGITGTTQKDPTSWYQTEYRGAYRNYALQLKNALSGASLFGIELLNEPHCGGQAACVQPYSSWASDMASALSGFTVGIGQKASENTTRGDSPGAGSPPDFTVSNASVGMASAHYYNASEKALALTAASQAGALGKTFYIGERGLTCDGSDGEAPSGGGGGGGIEPVQEPTCEPGKYKLTIKGTIKSSNVFLQSTDATTNETIFTDVRAASAGTAKGIPYVKNVPVDGAFMQLHDSQKIPGHAYNSGTIDGMLKQSYRIVTTKPGGTFIINAESHCGPTGNVYRDDWRGTGYEQYLTVSCADKVNGESSARMIVKDVLGYLLNLQGTDKEIEVDLGDINVDCQAVPRKTYPGVSMPGGNVKIAQRSREVYLACSGTNRITRMALPGVTGIDRGWNMDLIFKDEWDRGFLGFVTGLANWISSLFGNCGVDDTACWGTWLENHTPFEGRTEGRVDIQTQLYATEEHAILIDTLLGIKETVATRPLYFLKGAPSTYNGREIETYNGYEEKPQLVDCENFRRCSQTLSDPGYPMDNMQTCGGTAFTLGVPFGNVIKTVAGEIDPNLSGDAVRYRELPKSRQACADKSTSTDVIITIADIMPPEGYCGDMDGNDRVEGGEMPCPQYFSCGDYNGDGDTTDAGERSCAGIMVESSTPGDYSVPSPYKYDIRYFPYNLLYNSETTNNSEAESQTNQTADSYNNVCPHGDLAHGGDGTGYHSADNAKPANSICEGVKGSYAFKQQIETKFPCTDSLCFKTNENLETTDYDAKYPPSNLLATPQFPSGTDSRAIVVQSVAQVAQNVADSVDNRGNFFRIGVPDNLCSCSLVENGANADIGLANCLGDASLGSVPKANQPANIFDPTRDEKIGGDAQLTYLDRGPGISRTAGGADWELQQKLLATKGSQQDAHYEQSTKTFSFSTAVGYLMDAVSCAFGDGRVVNNPEGDITRDINCGRVLRTTANNTSKTRGSLPPLVSGGLALLNAFDPPFEDQTQIKSVSVVDSTMTKAELTTDGNPYGFNLANINDTEVPGSQGSGYLINKGDYGKKVQRDKFMNLVSNPIFVGAAAPAVPPVLTGLCTTTANTCNAGPSGTAFWNNQTVVLNSGSDVLAGVSSGVKISGTIKIRDPFTYDNSLGFSPSTVLNVCMSASNAACNNTGPGLPTDPRLTITDTTGRSGTYVLDLAAIAAACPSLIGDIKFDFIIPSGYRYSIDPVNSACFSPSGVAGVADSNTCYQGYVWSQVRGAATGWDGNTFCGVGIDCDDRITRKWCDTGDADPWIDMACNKPGCRDSSCYVHNDGTQLPVRGDAVSKAYSGNCYACGFGHPLGFTQVACGTTI